MPTFVPRRSVTAFRWDVRDALKWRHILKPYSDSSVHHCGKCGAEYRDHGWLPHFSRGDISGELVCPGMYIVEGPEGRWYAMEQGAFEIEFEVAA